MDKPIIYSQITNRLVVNCNIDGTMDLDKAREVLRFYRISNNACFKVLKELEKLELIEMVGRRKIKVKRKV